MTELSALEPVAPLAGPGLAGILAGALLGTIAGLVLLVALGGVGWFVAHNVRLALLAHREIVREQRGR